MLLDDCASDEFRCDKNQEIECIPLSKLCDFEADCLGGEDEQFCGKHSFVLRGLKDDFISKFYFLYTKWFNSAF